MLFMNIAHPYEAVTLLLPLGPCSVEDNLIGLHTSRILSKFQRFLSSLPSTDKSSSTIVDYIPTVTPRDSLIRVMIPLLQQMKQAVNFQICYVESWNPMVQYPASLMYLPLRQHDEILKDGCLQVMVELLHDFGLLNKSETKGHYDLTPNVEKRMLYLSGDCLSMDNF
jgi:hypothetical protein